MQLFHCGNILNFAELAKGIRESEIFGFHLKIVAVKKQYNEIPFASVV